MATDVEQLDDGEEAQVAWLLETGHDTPAMPREFVNALSRRLDSEFAALHSNGFHAAALKPSTNGAAHAATDAEKLVDVAPEPDASNTAPAKRVARSRRHWVLSIVAAASVVLG